MRYLRWGSSTDDYMRICIFGGYVRTPDPTALYLLRLADLHIQPPLPLPNRTTCGGRQDNTCWVTLWEILKKFGPLILRNAPSLVIRQGTLRWIDHPQVRHESTGMLLCYISIRLKSSPVSRHT